jgi:omega-hydroxy-beta-dihydromenaquinone-9 sulfotransferase
MDQRSLEIRQQLYINRCAKMDNSVHSPIFIVGNSRSGTTLLGRILDKHPQVYTIPHELHLFDEILSDHLVRKNKEIKKREAVALISEMLLRKTEGYFNNGKREDYVQQATSILSKQNGDTLGLEALVQLFFRFCIDSTKRMHICEQTPRNLFFISYILTIFPGAKIINLIRDPRGVLLSQKNKWKACVRFNQPKKEVVRTFLNYHPLNILFLWKRYVAIGEKFCDVYPDNCLTVNFDLFTKNPEIILPEICRFIGIEYGKKLLDIEVEMTSNLLEERKEGVNKEVSTTWIKQLNKTDIFLTEKIARKEVEKYGFWLSNEKPNYFIIAFIILLWPISTVLQVLLNGNVAQKIGRMGADR